MDLQKTAVKHGEHISKFRSIFFRKNVQRIAIFIGLFVIIYSLVASSIVPEKYSLSIGDVAATDISSPKEVIDEETTNKMIEEAVKAATEVPVYKTDNSVKEKALEVVSNFFNELKNIQVLSEDIRVGKLKEFVKQELNVELSDEDCSVILSTTNEELITLQENVEKYLIEVFDQGIEDKDDSVKFSVLYYQKSMEALDLNKTLLNLSGNIGKAVIKPNRVVDTDEMDKRIEEAKQSVEPVKVKKDQYIVKKGEVVTKGQIEILRSLGLLEEQSEIDILMYLGIGILVAMLEGLVIIYMSKYSREVLGNSNKLILLSIIITLTLLFAKVARVFPNSGYIAPVAYASMLIAILMQPRLALVVNIALAGYVTLMTGYNIDTLIYILLAGSTGAIVVTNMYQRNDFLKAGLLLSLINVFSILGVGFITSADIVLVLRLSLLGILNGVLSSVLAIGLLPFCEVSFGIVTPMKLLELSNPNQPVLKRLLYEAPGTYHHSIIVGNLAEAAADAIGGNSLLARVGAYYHDIGKLKRPYFFKENQLTSDNLHEKIAPSLSTLIITNHVKDGVELAKKYKLPDVIKDIIVQHHGTTLVKYFYIKAINNNDSHDEVNESQFRYEGPKPKRKEAAVVMMADSVEAAVRSLQSHAKPKIEEMVNKVIKEKIADGQLDDCDLTLKDINKITSAFLNVLNGIYHDRIEYPETNIGDKGDVENDANDRE